MGKSFDEIEKEYLAKYNSQKNVSNKSPLTNNATKKTGQMETSAFKSNNGNRLLRDAAYAISMPVKSVNNVVGAVAGDDGLSVKLGLNKPITQSWKDKQNRYNAGVDKNYQYDNSVITTNSIYDADREKVDKINKALGNTFSYDSYKSMPYDKLSYLNDDEKRTVAYYAQKGDYDSALDYIESLRDITAESRENLLAENQRVSDYLDNSGVVGKLVGDVYDMGTGLAGFYGSGLGTLATLKQIAYNMRNDVNDTVDENSAFFNAAAVNAQANENLLKDKKGIGKLATQIVQQSLQQYIPTMLLGYEAVPALFGLSSAGSSAYENAQNGTDAVTGMVDSVVKGIISYQSENLLSADKLFGLTGNSSPFLELSKESFKGLAKVMVGEAFEEAEEAVLDSVWEQAWVGNKSAISKEIGDYIAQGYSREEANKMAWSNFAKETGESMLIAALSAGVDTAATGTAGNMRVNRMMQNQSAREQTVLNAAELNADSEAYQNADRLASQDNISVKDAVKQYKLNWNENQAEWDTNLKDRYSEINNGILNEKSVETLKKALDGEKLSNKEAEMILKDNAAKELYQQYTDTDLDNIGTFAQQRRAIKNYSNNIVVNAEVGNAQTRVMNADTNTLSSLTGEAKTIADNLTNKGQTNGAKALAYVLSKNSSKDADKVASEFDYLYKQGFTGNSRINMLSNGVLDNAAAYVAFSAGINDNRLNLRNTQVVNKGKGGFIDSGAKVSDNIKKRMDVVGQKSGVKFRVEDNLTDTNGKKVNGYYDSGNNTIVISSDANIAQVAAHEWVHRLRKTSASSYKSLADNVMNTINKVPHLKRHYDEYLKRYNNDGLDNTAYFEEMVAEFTGDLYGIETVADMFGDVPTTTLGRIKKQLRNVISDFTRASSATDIAGLAKIDRAMGIAINRQAEIVNDWNNAKTLDKPIEVTAKNTNNNVDSITISAVNDDDKNTYSRLSYDDAKMRGMYDDLVKKGVLTKEESDRLMQAVDNAYKYMENFLDDDGNVLMSIDLNESVTRENRPFRVFKNNSDPLYICSLDFSTLCKKRLMAQAVIESLQKKLTDSNGKHKALSSKEQMAIRKAMIHWQAVDANIEVACGLCFVEAARLKAPKQINNFLANKERYANKYFAKSDKSFDARVKENQYNMLREMGYPAKFAKLDKYKDASPALIEQLTNTPVEKISLKSILGADKSKIDAANRAMRMDYANQSEISTEQAELIKELNSIPDEMFLTAEGLARIKTGDNGKLKYGGEIYNIYNYSIIPATRSKPQEIDMPYYYGDADEITQALIDKMNAESGLRTQSWSDFTTTHMLDYIIAISELSMKGAKMQAYTKVPNFVHFMGETGVMINLSLIPKGQSGFDANGNLVFSNTEGMPFNTALELRSQHKNTTGTISIGISDEQIVALLNDDRIDYVIPYHASGLNADLKKLADINQWKDYTKLQHDKQGNSMYDISFSEWFNNITYTDKNGNTRMNTPEELSEIGYSGKEIMKMAQDNFLRICNENGVTPRFSQFLTKENGQWKIDSGKTDNYWKLLIDRKMIDDLESKNNKVIIQQAVRPNFDESVMKKIIRETAETDSTETVKRITRAIEQDYLNKANGKESIIDKIIKRDTGLKKTDKAYADKYKALTAEINNGLDTLYDMPKIASKRDVYSLASPEEMAASFSFSRRDSAGNSLTAEQIKYFADSKIRDEDGNLLVVYHGTDADFTVFDRTKSRANMDIQGSFFSPWDIDAGGYGGNVKAYYLNIKNPAPESVGYKALNMFKGQNNAGVKAREYLESLGYDGVNNGGEEYIAFNPEQIKLVDNKKPTDNPDIRYSRTGDSSGKPSAQSIQDELNASDIKRDSKDNNKNNVRIRQYLNEKYPDLEVEFQNDKNTGNVKVSAVKTKEEARAQRERADREYRKKALRQAAEAKYYEKVKTWSGNQKLKQFIENKLEKDGIDATVTRSRSVVGSLSFYVEGANADGDIITVKISDHNTIDQQMTYRSHFVDIKYCTSNQEVYDEVKNILTKEGAVKISDNNELRYSKLPAYEERLLNGELFRGKSEKAVYEYTKDILAKMSSNLKTDETAERIQKLYDDMQRSLETDKKFGVTVINNYEAYQNRAQELAKEIVDSAVDITEDQNRMLKDEIAEYFRTTRLDTSSIQAADLGVDSKSEILRKYFGNFRFKKSSAGHSVHQVDTMYRELNGMYRGIFPDDITNSAEQFNRFIEVMDWIKTDESFEEKLFNEKDEDYELVVENVANSILGNYWLTADAPLKTDMQKYVNKLKNEIERLKEEVNAAKTQTDKDKLLRDWLRAKDFNEGKSRANAKWEKKNVKAMEKIESLESVVDDLIFQIYADQETLAKTIETHKNLNRILDIATTFKQWGKGVRSASELNDPVLTEYARQLGKIKYRSDIRKASSRGIIATLDPFYKQSILGDYYSDEIRTRIDFILANKESTKPLSNEEIQAISDIMQGIKHLYQTYDKMVMNGKRVGIREVAKAESDILDKSTYSETRIKLFNMLSNKLNTRVGYDASKAVNAVLNEVVEPRVVFGTVESFDENGILIKAFNDITKGETEMNRLNIEMLREANDFIKEHKGYGARLKNKTIVFEGRTISVGQAITLYMTMQRQQAWRSLTGEHVGAGAWIKDAKSGKYSHLVWTKRNASVEEQRQVMKDVSDVLYNTLSEEDRQFITIAQNLFDGMSKELKRETDMKILGFTNIEEESGYIPISRKGTQIAKAYADTNSMLKDVTSAYNYSFNKDLKKNVQLGLEILDIYDLMKSHSRKMSMYAALTNPLQNLDKILNCNLAYDDEGNKVGVYNIRERLNEMWSGWDKYYSNLITDIQNKGNGGQSVIVNKVRSAFANAQLGFNPKVVLTQFASYPTAMIYLDADSLTKGVGMKTDFEALDKYSGYAMTRAYEDGVVQSEGLIDTWGKITQFTTKGISFMDRQTIGKLWNACQVEVESKDNLKIGTEENYKAAAELLEKVCRGTQPNYSNSERSGLMRNKNAIISSFTMFTSVPLKQLSRTVESATKLSLLNDAYKNNPSAENKQKLDNAKKEAARVQASIFLANAMYVLMAMGVKWLLPKKEEDKEITTAKFATGMFETYIGMMPLAKDLYNYFVNGYDFNNFFYSSVTDALGAVKNFTSDFADDPVHATVDFASVIAQMFGMPIRNAQNVYKGVMNRVFVTQGGELGYKALKTTKSVTSSYYRDDYLELISNTLLKGDVETAKTIINDMVKSGVNKSTISSSMKTYLAKKIYKAWKENDKKTFNDVNKTLKALGWSQKTIESQIITQMKKEIVTDDKDFQKLLRLVKNYRAGKSRYTREELLEMIDDLITKWTDKGYNRSTVESIFKSALK